MAEDMITMQELLTLCKGRGFIFSGSEIYGGLANAWDYGPLGVELKNNIKQAWWKRFISESEHNVGLDAAILMNPGVWKASGHIDGFSDPLMDCKGCKTRLRADKLLEEWAFKNKEIIKTEGVSNEVLEKTIADKKICCPSCGKNDFTPIRQFNLMFKTFMGVTEDKTSEIYLRPETAGGIFVNFNNVLRSTRSKMPMGIGQIGKSFRNEITPGNFIFRTREFEQMELEFFCAPSDSMKWFEYWRKECYQFLLDIGVKKESLRLRDHDKDELSFYSKATTDIEFLFPFGWGELWGIANRTDYDLKQHAKHSGADLSYTDPFTNEKYVPHCIEPSVGVERAMLAILASAFEKEALKDGRNEKTGEEDTRIVMKFAPNIAPIKAAILPLSKKLEPASEEIYKQLRKSFRTDYDSAGSIGKRYRRQDEIGTPLCITVDFETENDKAVTVRDRDTMKQERVKITELKDYISKKLGL